MSSRLSYWSQKFKWSRAVNAGAMSTDMGSYMTSDTPAPKTYEVLGIQDVATENVIKAKSGEAQKRGEAIADFWIQKRASQPEKKNPFERFLS